MDNPFELNMKDIINDSDSTMLNSSIMNAGHVIIGEIVKITPSGEPEVICHGYNKSMKAISTIAIMQQHIGRQVAMMFTQTAQGNQPIIMGIIHNPLLEILQNSESENSRPVVHDTELEVIKEQTSNTDSFQKEEWTMDGEKVVLEGKKEIVLKCGDASITLTECGKILIRGKFIASRSTGVNRIFGASVQVN